jgi:hypothetical protein
MEDRRAVKPAAEMRGETRFARKKPLYPIGPAVEILPESISFQSSFASADNPIARKRDAKAAWPLVNQI